MTRLDDVGEADGWRCWLCDEAVDPDMSVNDDRGPSIDSMTTQRKAKGKGTESIFGSERLAHRGCNTKKGRRCSSRRVAQGVVRCRPRLDRDQCRAIGPKAWQRSNGSMPIRS